MIIPPASGSRAAVQNQRDQAPCCDDSHDEQTFCKIGVDVSDRGGISADHAVRASVAFDCLKRAGEGFCWLETHPKRGGGTRLVRWNHSDGPTPLTLDGFSVASDLHAYGGDGYAVTREAAWCCGEGGLYRVRADESTLVTGGVFGDLVPCVGELLAVRETVDGDELVAVASFGPADVRVLAADRGFLGAPRPGAEMLAWTRWSAHTMPWDSCEVWLAPYQPGGRLGDPVRVAGGPEESAIEPVWGPDGALYFMSDRTGWWNLYRYDGASVTAVAPMAAECAAEPWELGYASYGFLADGRVVMVVQEGPRHRLMVGDGRGSVEAVDLPYTSIKPYLAVSDLSVALIGSSPMVAPQVTLVQLGGGAPRMEVLARAEHPDLDGAAVSTPVELLVTVQAGREVVALVYPPTGALSGWRAPLIVRAHPGPTASSLMRLDWQAQYFTSRGFAVVDVDYTGSTGYGRAFRQALYGRWGIDDVADCRAVAERLITEGHAIAGQVFIRGASAGGYTALQAVSQDGPFVAATAVSAIVDPGKWAETVPRFQRPHAERLRGGAGGVSAAGIQRPVLLIHGADDAVAAADDVVELAQGLAQRGAMYELLVLEGVGHSVARSRAAAAALEAELRLYQRTLNAAQAD